MSINSVGESSKLVNRVYDLQQSALTLYTNTVAQSVVWKNINTKSNTSQQKAPERWKKKKEEEEAEKKTEQKKYRSNTIAVDWIFFFAHLVF